MKGDEVDVLAPVSNVPRSTKGNKYQMDFQDKR